VAVTQTLPFCLISRWAGGAWENWG